MVPVVLILRLHRRRPCPENGPGRRLSSSLKVVDTTSPLKAPRRPAGFLICSLAGLQAGVAGVIWMFGVFVVAAFWSGRGVWSVPNLFSTVFYGDFAYQDIFLRSTWAGL